ncbi:glucosaminidase domain-containing protein [Neobacillus sp. PS2-9]|uniref:glucosaminidase domain-containing protein n=1 Tax=Neobacillus sp. PS2-9 TaxID=3070676 RepID=UPI0027E12E8F|nr:glucosaminidase domain-containing protein [Neobacillus sp. PS2-9]WML59026.1 glucosaminidase domain-containing protein [Neobacillus sp. PS2-9]
MKKKRFTALALATMLFSSTASGVAASETYTWKYQNNSWYYLSSTGKTVKGWVLYNKNWYYLGSNGVMKTGWLLDKNIWYYLDRNSGAMKTGWLKENNIWYFLLPSGAMKTGWLLDRNSWYYLEKSGAMKVGWIEDKGLKYYLSLSGAMITGQKFIEGKPYVFASSGALNTSPLTGWFRDGSIVMYFDSGGVMHKGWLVEDANKYYFKQDGLIHTGWLEENNKKYFFALDGKMQVGWLNDGDKRYYLGTDGALKTGWITYGGKSYYLGTDGVMYKGWLTEGDKKFYLGKEGTILTGLQTIDNQLYYFGTNGVMQKNSWITIENKKYYLGDDGAAVKGWMTKGEEKYYFGSDGVMVNGWQNVNKKWYYFNSDGTMETGWVYVNGKWYYLNANGEMQTGWLTDNGSTYYFTNNGDMFIGWLALDNKWYYFDTNGKMVTGEKIIDGKTYNFFEDGVLNTGPVVKTTSYNLSYQQMLDLEMTRTPQTDKYRNVNAYVSSEYVLKDVTDPTKGVVISTTPLNVRENTNTNSFIFGTLKNGSQVTIVSTVGTWYEIKYDTWRNAKSEDVSYYLNPNTFSSTSTEYFQFLLLNKSAGTTAKDLNAKPLAGKGILDGKGQAFIQASQQYNVNEVYLISHSLLETGNGTSQLAKGIIVDTVDGQPVEPKTVYNMYGVGAIDSCPNTCGSQYAYKQGWFTPEAAIIGGAAFIGQGYINASVPQNTLYKMRWNPINPSHQYATDIGWAVKQTNNIKRIYDSLSSYTLYYELPEYK